MTARRLALIQLFLFASLTLNAQSTVTIQATPNPAVLGAPVVITATVTPASATGLVAFYDGVTLLGTKPLTSGAASLSTIALSPGVRKLRAYYGGDASNAAASSAAISQTINAQPAVSLATGIPLSAPQYIYNFATGDFNADGKPDVALASGANIIIELGDAAGNFRAGYTASIPFAGSLITADFNGDGVSDLALTTLLGPLYVLLGNGDGTFQAAVSYSAPSAGVVAAGDFNRDGKADLVVSNNGNGVSVLLGKGDGTFQPAVAYVVDSRPNTGTSFVLVADMNGDGKPDLVTGSSGGSRVSVLLGNGNGTFQTPIIANTPNSNALAAGDFNGDGKTDIAGAGPLGVDILLGNGDGTLKPPVTYPTATFANSIVVGDFNGDGKTDLATGGLSTYILIGRGDGTFASPTVYSTTSVLGLISGDFNGDGRSDLLGSQGLTLQVLLGSPNSILATAGTPQSVAINTPFPAPIEITLKQGNTPLSSVTVTYTAPADAPLTATAILSTITAVTDANGIARVNATANARAGAYTVTAQALGLTAVFTLNNLNAPPSILKSSPTMRQSALLGAAFTLPLQVTLTDLYGSQASGYPVTFTAPSTGATAALSASTVITNAAGQATVTAIANNVAGSYVVTATFGGLSVTFPLTNAQPVSVTLGTSANTSNLSAPVTLTATVNSTSATGRVTFFDGTTIIGIRSAVAGVATLSTTQLPAGPHKLSAYYRDDGNSIAGLSNVITQTVRALAGGAFTTLNPVAFNPSPFSTLFGDFNGDGKVDLAFAGFVNGLGWVVTVAIGKGDGSFQPSVDYFVSPTGAYNLAISDFNGDGKPDLAVTTIANTNNLVNTSISILLGNGDGTFRPAVNYPAIAGQGSLPFSPIAVGDFNGDGKADVAFGYVTTAHISEGPTIYPTFVNLLLGNGDGTLAAPLVYSSLPSYTSPPTVNLLTGDFNGDGKVDLIVGTGFSNAYIVLGNGDGTGQTPVSVGETRSSYNALISGDLDGDGKLDLIVDSEMLLGKGDGSFQPAVHVGPGLVLAVSDFNGDGILDLVASGSSATPTSILFGRADGTFQQGTVPTGAYPMTGVADFNGDGIADLITSTGASASVLLGVATGSNPSGQPASITASAGTPQTVLVGAAFAPLVVTVKDANGQPVSGAIVTFTPPATGPGATLSAVTAVTNSFGVASLSATANNIPGSYVVTASVAGLSTTFELTNSLGVAGSDLALGRTATQSSTLPGYTTAGAAAATDGNTDGNFFNGSVTHTNLEANPWWQVDLATSSAIGSVVVWNRTDCCPDRLTDYWVFISDTPFGAGDTPATLSNRAATFSYHQTVAPNPFTAVQTSGAQGRYVRVQLSGTNNLSLAEVQVVPAGAASTNLALNRTATQSGNYYPGSDASRAVDGNTDGNFYDGSVAHTGYVPNAWWQVDLGAPAVINSLMIWNRTDCCGSRLSDYWVFVSNDPFLAADTPTTLQNRAGTYGVHQTTAPNPSALVAIGIQGRYVRIQLSTTDLIPLNMAEVQVFGTGGAAASTNIAVSKAASQSSTLPGYSTAVAGSAVDGNTDGNFFDGSVSHTDLQANPWWQVDLGASASITSVTIWNRTDPCCVFRLENYWIFVSDTPFLPTDTPTTLRNRAGTASFNQGLAPDPRTTIALVAQGRYVRIQSDGTGYLNLAEVQIFGTRGTPAVTNVAAGKSASQSSTLAGYTTTGAEKAVDGNTNGGFFNGSVTHTNPEANAWWQVDLGTTPTINSVVVWNRTDCCSDRLNDYWVFASNTPFVASDTPATLQGRANTFASHQTAAPSPSTTINVGTAGRYVRVQLSGVNPLSLAEVQVFGQ